MDSNMLNVGAEAIPEGLPENIQADTLYDVQLREPVVFAGIILSPSAQQQVRGSLLTEIKESVYGARESKPDGAARG